jgi:glycosyltransferase involved in cell wall biosynthesis
MLLAFLTTDNREDRRDYTSPNPYFGTAPQALLDGFAAFPGEIEVHVVSCTREHLPSPLRLASNILFHSVQVPAWAWLKLGYLGNIRAVRRCLKGIQPDLVHGQGTERDCALTAVFSGYPAIITLHGNMRQLARLSGARPWSYAGLTALLESMAIRASRGVVCLSNHTQGLVSPNARQSWLIPNAVNPAFLNIKRAVPLDMPIILLVGDATPNKNHLSFLEAIAPLQADCKFEVRHCGNCDPGDPYAAQLLDFIEHHSWCRSCGFLKREAMMDEMAPATLLVLPSLEENLPMVILEAMAAGVPVAASNVGGIPDLITDGANGRLFDPSDAQSMRHIIHSMLTDPVGTQQLATRAREQILRNHQPETIACKHLEVYAEVVKEKLKAES